MLTHMLASIYIARNAPRLFFFAQDKSVPHARQDYSFNGKSDPEEGSLLSTFTSQSAEHGLFY